MGASNAGTRRRDMNVKGMGISAVALAVLGGPLLATSAQAATTAKATSLSVHAAKATVKAKTKDTVSGTLKSGKSVLAKQRVLLEEKAAGAKKFTVVGKGTTNTHGVASFSVYPTKGKDSYQLVFAATKAYKGSHSAVVVITAK
jgi:hypothetical protein